jgi:dihydroxyacetone kinase-like protein
MAITSTDLTEALRRVSSYAEKHRAELCSADAKIGDGDLGITVAEGFAACARLDLPEDIGRAFFDMSKAFQQASSSSFGTLVATGMMTAAKALKGATQLDPDRIADLVAEARDAMLARGKSSLGEKTVLDGLHAQAEALAQAAFGERLAVAVAAAENVVAQFRDKPNLAGRARIFGERSVGLPDPGQMALVVITRGLQ